MLHTNDELKAIILPLLDGNGIDALLRALHSVLFDKRAEASWLWENDKSAVEMMAEYNRQANLVGELRNKL